ncbi:MAG: bifunctional (p)ppGpp synthetase/guanosine-3',5'-bis(diphosphate) 3'-pyrophosphohydrolase [Cyclobacteriaceae bacterium]|nr:bifunctional (p)ppGpp synthetase/guanosine-3',5'-bis(diphosphate) 3'-pyrophosphohydrolase [Cyclobacteriaceae bacterium]
MLVVDVEEEKRELIRRYRRLLRKAKPFLKDNDAKIIKKAFNVCVDAHKEMRRKSGEPYVYHPIAVAEICVNEIGLGTTSIVSALLHDVVEDTDWELEDIELDFGKKIAKIIDGLTKISGVFEHGSSQQAENFRKMLFTLSEDVRVILIKIADRLHNMRTLQSMPRNKQLRTASETIYLYAPLAHRLGLYAIKSELEDLYLRYTERSEYEEIESKIQESKGQRVRFISNFGKPIKEEIHRLGLNFEIKGRPKSVYSIWRKMKEQNVPFEEVYDIFAIRIIIDVPLEEEKSACWMVYSVVTDFYRPNPDRLRDWISTPKANGYESLHTTVMGKNGQWVEVQIRTKRMDEIAEKGYAAHWKYKHNINVEESQLEQWLAAVRDTLEQNNHEALEFVDNFRGSLFAHEIFVFSPKGDLYTLPFGATALDFAFSIHTEVGSSCIGAKVNQKLVPISYSLKNGDQVEILTSSKQKPTEDWLRFVVTAKARGRIKDGLKEEKKYVAEEGEDMVKRKLKQLKIDPNPSNIDALRDFMGVKSKFDLYFKVGEGSISIQDFKKFKINAKEQSVRHKTVTKISDAKTFEKVIRKAKGTFSDILLIGEDMDIVDYKLARCCNPIPGDDVFGFVTVSEGIKIHRTGCPNASELLSQHGNRVVKAKWASQHEQAFLAGIKVIGVDRVGLINDISAIISEELKVNMRSMSIDTDAGIFEGEIMLYVNDTKHLDMMMSKLKKVEGVAKVTRFEYKD